MYVSDLVCLALVFLPQSMNIGLGKCVISIGIDSSMVDTSYVLDS